MACPGGCVNGGGQIKPPARLAGTSSDAEGYQRDWENSGVRLEDAAVPTVERWGDKEWVKNVETVYWTRDHTGLPTPPRSPTSSSVPSRLSHSALDDADSLAARVVSDLCSSSDGEAVRTREELFRTDYRAVESDVIGLAVKW